MLFIYLLVYKYNILLFF